MQIRWKSHSCVGPSGRYCFRQCPMRSWICPAISSGKMTPCPASPCFKALRATFAFPSIDFGPVDLDAFRLFASICFWLATAGRSGRAFG